MLTSVGKFLRKIRIDNGEVLKDMGQRLSVSPAFLSAVENGKKSVPKRWISSVPQLYSLTPEKTNEWNEALIQSVNVVKVTLCNASVTKRRLAESLAQQLNSIDDDTAQKILDILAQS